MKPFVVRQATVDDAHKIAPMLREQDRREVLAASGYTPEVVLPTAFTIEGDKDIIFAETVDGDPILIAGVRETQPRIGAIWMVGTPLIEQYAFRYARHARRKVDKEWHAKWPCLWNMAWADNDLHVRWLEYMGFKFLRRVEHRGHSFIEFARHKNVR